MGTSACVGERGKREKGRQERERGGFRTFYLSCLKIIPSSVTWITADASWPFFLRVHLLPPPAAFSLVSLVWRTLKINWSCRLSDGSIQRLPIALRIKSKCHFLVCTALWGRVPQAHSSLRGSYLLSPLPGMFFPLLFTRPGFFLSLQAASMSPPQRGVPCLIHLHSSLSTPLILHAWPYHLAFFSCGYLFIFHPSVFPSRMQARPQRTGTLSVLIKLFILGTPSTSHCISSMNIFEWMKESLSFYHIVPFVCSSQHSRCINISYQPGISGHLEWQHKWN